MTPCIDLLKKSKIEHKVHHYTHDNSCSSYGNEAAMADVHNVQKTTGYILGGVSPIGQKKRLRTVIDLSTCDFLSIFVSAGKRGLEVELRADDLKTLTNAKFEDIKSEA